MPTTVEPMQVAVAHIVVNGMFSRLTGSRGKQVEARLKSVIALVTYVPTL